MGDPRIAREGNIATSVNAFTSSSLVFLPPVMGWDQRVSGPETHVKFRNFTRLWLNRSYPEIGFCGVFIPQKWAKATSDKLEFSALPESQCTGPSLPHSLVTYVQSTPRYVQRQQLAFWLPEQNRHVLTMKLKEEIGAALDLNDISIKVEI